MKRRYIYLVLLALLPLFSCRKGEGMSEEPRVEFCFVQTVEGELPLTRGVVNGTSLVDSESGDRDLYVTSFLHPQFGNEINYFVNERFVKTAGGWKREPSVYWPVGAVMDMMAYSSETPFNEFDISWGEPNNAEIMRLRVGNDRTQDDVLYGACWSQTNPGAGNVTAISMHHSQALLEFTFARKAGSMAVCKVESVTITDCYLAGDLIVSNNAGAPTHRWDFRRYIASNAGVDDVNNVIGTVLTSTPVSLSMLVPEQEMKSVIVTYTVNGEQKTTVKELPHGNWVAGRHYTYVFTVTD